MAAMRHLDQTFRRSVQVPEGSLAMERVRCTLNQGTPLCPPVGAGRAAVATDDRHVVEYRRGQGHKTRQDLKTSCASN